MLLKRIVLVWNCSTVGCSFPPPLLHCNNAPEDLERTPHWGSSYQSFWWALIKVHKMTSLWSWNFDDAHVMHANSCSYVPVCTVQVFLNSNISCHILSCQLQLILQFLTVSLKSNFAIKWMRFDIQSQKQSIILILALSQQCCYCFNTCNAETTVSFRTSKNDNSCKTQMYSCIHLLELPSWRSSLRAIHGMTQPN